MICPAPQEASIFRKSSQCKLIYSRTGAGGGDRHHRVKPENPVHPDPLSLSGPGPPPQSSPFGLASPLVFADAAKTPFASSGPSGAPVMCKQTGEFSHKSAKLCEQESSPSRDGEGHQEEERAALLKLHEGRRSRRAEAPRGPKVHEGRSTTRAEAPRGPKLHER